MSPLQYQLNRQIYVAYRDDAAVILDSRRNRYHGLSGHQASALRLILGSSPLQQQDSPPFSDDDLRAFARSLESLDLLVRAESSPESGAMPAFQRPLSAFDDASGIAASRPQPGHAIRFLRNYLPAEFRVRRGSLSVALDELRSRKRRMFRRESLPERELHHLLSVFGTLRPFFYANRDQCLLDSLALAGFLMSHGVATTFVIGVRFTPFVAHSWVQHGTCVLNGPLLSAQRCVPMVTI